jgi:hypothetical protein
MAEAQQLVATHMLGVSLEGMLDLSPWGYEVMSTHFVKTVIVASCAISFEERPSLQDALKTIGFDIDPNSTSESVKKTWDDLADWTAHGWKNATQHLTTSFAVELRILEDVEFDCTGSTNDETSTISNDKGRCLQIDCNAAKVLQGMGNTVESAPELCPPVAFVNTGNSPFPDGFVTFYAVKKFQNENEMPQHCTKWTIAIQAKDYHFGTSLNAKSLNKHADRTKDTILNRVFGTKRFLAVASGHASLFARRRVEDREFLPYQLPATHSSFMSGLLGLMERNEQSRIKKFATFIYDPGNKRRRLEKDI